MNYTIVEHMLTVFPGEYGQRTLRHHVYRAGYELHLLSTCSLCSLESMDRGHSGTMSREPSRVRQSWGSLLSIVTYGDGDCYYRYELHLLSTCSLCSLESMDRGHSGTMSREPGRVRQSWGSLLSIVTYGDGDCYYRYELHLLSTCSLCSLESMDRGHSGTMSREPGRVGQSREVTVVSSDPRWFTLSGIVSRL
ncbi:hypothetical protein J6590_001275 [Homalodisca vitripennis]|nr:hypothetical protein J6590_001275 [Homalodisca vitripennis]